MKSFIIKDLSGRGYNSKQTEEQIVNNGLLDQYGIEEQTEIKEYLSEATTGDEYATNNMKFICI